MAKVVNIKCVCVGDGAVGKTMMLSAYAGKQVTDDYIPTVFDNFNVNIEWRKEGTTTNTNSPSIIASLILMDTAGQEDYDDLREICYTDTNVFIVCFSITNPVSYQNVLNKWYPEIRAYSKTVPIVLVGTKLDLRDSIIFESVHDNIAPICFKDGEALKKKIGAFAYCECSGLKRMNLNETFHRIVEAHLSNNWDMVFSPPKQQQQPPPTKHRNHFKSFHKKVESFQDAFLHNGSSSNGSSNGSNGGGGKNDKRKLKPTPLSNNNHGHHHQHQHHHHHQQQQQQNQKHSVNESSSNLYLHYHSSSTKNQINPSTPPRSNIKSPHDHIPTDDMTKYHHHHHHHHGTPGMSPDANHVVHTSSFISKRRRRKKRFSSIMKISPCKSSPIKSSPAKKTIRSPFATAVVINAATDHDATNNTSATNSSTSPIPSSPSVKEIDISSFGSKAALLRRKLSKSNIAKKRKMNRCTIT